MAMTRVLFVRERVTTQRIITPSEQMANLMALQHARIHRVNPGPLLKGELAKLPAVEVYRGLQGWVDRRGRARVGRAYLLAIGGKVVMSGSKRYIMRQADWAVMCDAAGRLPVLETTTGVAKRRALYKARKARRWKPAPPPRGPHYVLASLALALHHAVYSL